MFPFARTALAVLAVLYAHAGSAAVVSIDASIGGETIFSTNCPGPVSCTPNGYKTPLYHVTAGDVIDLGSVLLGPAFADQGRSQFPAAFSYEGQLGLNWGPIDLFDATGPLYSSCYTAGCVPTTPPDVYERLLFVVPTGATELQLAFTGPYVYTAPSVASAVPEPATWAMLLLGFSTIGFLAARRRERHAAAKPLTDRCDACSV